MAKAKKTEEAVVTEEEAKKAPKKTTKKAPKKAKEEVKPVSNFKDPVSHDYDVIYAPVITEKSMALLQNASKVTVKVNKSSNKIEIADSFERLYGVKVIDVKIVNVDSKAKSRGGRYKGSVPGFKKAIITLPKDAEIDLFKE